MHRAQTSLQRELAAAFIDWGIPTAESIQFVRKAAPEVLIFASGGIRDGIDIAKSIALGATLGGMAGHFLKAAAESEKAVLEAVQLTIQQLRVAMFAVGAPNLQALRQARLVKG